jgi:hypothetical protein
LILYGYLPLDGKNEHASDNTLKEFTLHRTAQTCHLAKYSGANGAFMIEEKRSKRDPS